MAWGSSAATVVHLHRASNTLNYPKHLRTPPCASPFLTVSLALYCLQCQLYMWRNSRVYVSEGELGLLGEFHAFFHR